MARLSPNPRSAVALALGALLVSTALPGRAAGQDTPPLAITSPADGTLVAPGQTVIVTVTSPSGTTFDAIGLSGDDPIGPVDVAASLPASFSVSIPATARSGRYTLTALAATSDDESVTAAVTIDVERPDLPGRVYARLPEVVFDAAGETSAITLLANFFDGSVPDVTASTSVTYVSSDPAVATVDAAGVVTAAGPGYAEVLATYGPPDANLSATVPVYVPDPLFTVSPLALDFGTLAVGGVSAAQEVTLTNRSGEPLTITDVATTGDFAATDSCVAASPLAADATCTIDVTFAPTDAGPRDGTLSVASVVSSIGVRLSGAGTPPAVTITGFTPEAGPVGTSVTIAGTGFDASPAQDTVTFNGVLALVTSASPAMLVATVPVGATTGTIAVSTPAGSATSATAFTVTGPPPPAISGFTPSIGLPGDVVTINGDHFDPVAKANQTRFNLARARPTASTPSAVTVPVPEHAGSGRITITTAAGTAVSSDDFIVPPAPYGPADVAVSGRIPFGVATTVSVPPDRIGLLLFDGTAGQRVSLLGTEGTSGVSSDCDVMVTLLRPNDTALGAATCMEGSGFVNTKTLSATGTYAILVDPADGISGSVTLHLFDVPPDATATIAPGGPAVTVAIGTPGQNGAVTFAGAAGQRVSLRVTEAMAGQVAGCDVRVSLQGPDGSTLAPFACVEGDGFIDARTLPSAGSYTIVVDPREEATGTLTLTLYDVPLDATGAVTIGGPAVGVPIGTPGQNASLTFDGSEGAPVTVLVTGNTVGRLAVRVLAPDGTELAARTSAAASFKLPALTLPASGTYAIALDPVGPGTGPVAVGVTSP